MKERICWICGGEANSKEHKHKASLIRKNFGKKYGVNELSVYKNGIEHKLSSYKDKELIFTKKICTECNNVLTKPHDNAYDELTNFIDQSFKNLQINNEIELKDIFGTNWNDGYKNLVKYFAKNIGCRIFNSKTEIEIENLAKLIKNEIPNTFFKLKFVFKEEIESFMKDDGKQIPNIFMGPGIRFGEEKDDINYGTWYSYQWVSVYCVYTNRKLKKNIFHQDESKLKFEKQAKGALSKYKKITLSEGRDIIEAYQHPSDEALRSYCYNILSE